MSDAENIASLAGTWVGAGVGLFGIIAVVGPLLVWWASRTEHHKALMRIGRKNNGYLSNGIPVWPGIRFLQSARPPKVESARPFTGKEWGDFKLTRLKRRPIESKATWVQFGACLEAYGLNLRRGNELVLEEGLLKLPVHKIYLFTFLVLGRYQKKPRRSGTTASTTMLDRRPIIRLSLPNGSQFGRDDSDKVLYGLTGVFRFTKYVESNGQAQFTEDLALCQKEVAADKISPSTIMLLACGVLPLPSDQYLWCTTGVEDVTTRTDVYSRDSSSESSDHSTNRARMVSNITPAVMQEDMARKAQEELIIEAFELQKLEWDPSDILLDSIISKKTGWGLNRMDDEADLQELLCQLAAMSVVPPEEPFVRVPLHDFRRTGRFAERVTPRIDQWDIAFIDRKSAQIFALSLLKLPWSQNNYVVGRRTSTSLVRNLLTQAAPSAIRFIWRMKENPSALGLRQSDLANVLAATDRLLQNDLDVRSLCELDEVLNSVQHPLGEVALMVGVLLLTNVEYRELIYQSVRHVSTTMSNQQDTETVLDFDKGHVIVVGAFGVRYTFVVDLSGLLDHLPGHQRTQELNIRVTFGAVLLAAFKAYLRSFMFTQCIDGADIEEAMDYEKDVYHIA